MSKPSTPVKADAWKAFQAEAKGLERDYLAEIMQSRTTWKRLSFLSLGITAASVVAVMGLTPLKRTEAVVVRVDQSTGFVDVVSKLADQSPTQGVAVDKYFLKQYVQRREAYDYYTIQTDYERTALYSTPDVQREFFKIYQGEDARDKTLKNHYRIEVATKTIQLNAEDGTAVIRFSTDKRAMGGSSTPPEHTDWIATVGYKYVQADMTESDRRDNPLGFQVTSYRVDREIVGGQ